MRLSVKVPPDKLEEGLDEITSVMRHIRGLRPNEKNDFAINQTKAFEKQYTTLKIAIGGTGLFITLLSKEIFPLDGFTNPAIPFNSEDLPHPEGPNIHTNSPGLIVAEISFKA